MINLLGGQNLTAQFLCFPKVSSAPLFEGGKWVRRFFNYHCHCEERSDVAISWYYPPKHTAVLKIVPGDCHGPLGLAMTCFFDRFPKGSGLPRQCAHWLAMTWKFDTSPISFACLQGVSKGGNGGKVGFQNAFSVPHFGRLEVRDHTGGPGGSLHTFSPERKYDILLQKNISLMQREVEKSSILGGGIDLITTIPQSACSADSPLYTRGPRIPAGNSNA